MFLYPGKIFSVVSLTVFSKKIPKKSALFGVHKVRTCLKNGEEFFLHSCNYPVIYMYLMCVFTYVCIIIINLLRYFKYLPIKLQSINGISTVYWRKFLKFGNKFDFGTENIHLSKKSLFSSWVLTNPKIASATSHALAVVQTSPWNCETRNWSQF